MFWSGTAGYSHNPQHKTHSPNKPPPCQHWWHTLQLKRNNSKTGESLSHVGASTELLALLQGGAGPGITARWAWYEYRIMIRVEQLMRENWIYKHVFSPTHTAALTTWNKLVIACQNIAGSMQSIQSTRTWQAWPNRKGVLHCSTTTQRHLEWNEKLWEVLDLAVHRLKQLTPCNRSARHLLQLQASRRLSDQADLNFFCLPQFLRMQLAFQHGVAKKQTCLVRLLSFY